MIKILLSLLLLASVAYAGEVTIDGTPYPDAQVTITTNGQPPEPPPIVDAPLLSPNDVNMVLGEATGIQTVGDTRYYRFVLPTACNRVTVAWTSFDWVGRVDMLVRIDTPPTLADWQNATHNGYPAISKVVPLCYSLFQVSGDGGETLILNYVPSGTYYIMMKNTNTEASRYKVWYAPRCDYQGR